MLTLFFGVIFIIIGIALFCFNAKFRDLNFFEKYGIVIWFIALCSIILGLWFILLGAHQFNA